MRSNIGFDFAKIDIQPKLRVSQPSDVCEQEADRIAEQVMRVSDSNSITSAVPNKKEDINRKYAAYEVEEEEEEKMKISRKPSDISSLETDGSSYE